MASIERVVIVGGGLAGGAAARELRATGFDGHVAVVGAELHPPYERPPLSKEYLRGESSAADAFVEPETYWREHDVELLPGRTAAGLDLTGARLELDDGGSVPFDRLLLATGARPRTLDVPGSELDGVVTLRTFDEADTIRSRARQAGRVLVVGGGWIGCEVSASLRALDCEVTLALPGRLPLERTLGPEVATVYARMHTSAGVDLRARTSIVAFDGADGLRRARTESGQWIECELAVVAIGVRPRVELAAAAGLRVEDGIVVNGSLATSDPRVFAAGDVALAPSPLLARSIRVEHWGTALAQGRHAARSMLGGAPPCDEIPYFYSDQYDSGMEFWGDPAHPGELVTRGEPAERAFTAFWCQNGRVSAVLNMHVHHSHGDHDHGDHDHGDHDHGDPAGASMHAGGHINPEDVERLLRSGKTIDVAALRNPEVPLGALTDSGR